MRLFVWDNINLSNLSSKKIALAFVAAALIFLYISYQLSPARNGFPAQLLLLLAGASLSIFITLTVVRLALQADHEKRWKWIRSTTRRQILSLLAHISYLISIHLVDRAFIHGSSFPAEKIDALRQQEKIHIDVAKAIMDLADYLNKIDFKRMEIDTYTHNCWDAEENRLKILLFCYAFIERDLEELQLVLIPRVFSLSSDQEEIGALVWLDASCSRLRSAAIMAKNAEKLPKEIKSPPFICENFVYAMIEFLRESGKIYENLLEDNA